MPSIDGAAVRTIVIACDAGMASSVLMSAQLRKQLAPQVVVRHSPVDALPAEADVVLTHDKLSVRARSVAGDRPVVAYTQLVGDPAVAGLVHAIRQGGQITA